jgi:FAD/FMN-containing dehydrogenase
MTAFFGLRWRLTGTIPDDTDYTASVDAFKCTTRRQTDAVARAASEADVVEIVRFARAEGMPLQLHSTGHGAQYAYDSGVLLVVSALDG